ncbi:helix-turn-helix domain-containing protein, partial [Klebsiella pneumoniae]
MRNEMKDRIRARRVQLDITQQTLAKKLGVSRVS